MGGGEEEELKRGRVLDAVWKGFRGCENCVGRARKGVRVDRKGYGRVEGVSGREEGWKG